MASVLIAADAALRFKPIVVTIQYPCQARCSTPKARTQNSPFGIQIPLWCYFISDRSQQDLLCQEFVSCSSLFNSHLAPSRHPYPHLLLHIRHSVLICSLTFLFLFVQNFCDVRVASGPPFVTCFVHFFIQMFFGQFEHGCMTLHISST